MHYDGTIWTTIWNSIFTEEISFSPFTWSKSTLKVSGGGGGGLLAARWSDVGLRRRYENVFLYSGDSLRLVSIRKALRRHTLL